jgi:DNA-binding MarR family transcriptional regulator
MDAIVLAIQQLYPRIYHACHVAHRRTHCRGRGLAEHEAALLAHLDSTHGVTARELGKHLGKGAPALSATIARLEGLGLVQRTPRRGRSPARGITLTPNGTAAVQASSVLDTIQLTALVARLSPRQRTAAVAGLRLLADAAFVSTAEDQP